MTEPNSWRDRSQDWRRRTEERTRELLASQAVRDALGEAAQQVMDAAKAVGLSLTRAAAGAVAQAFLDQLERRR